ncbi:MAG: lipoprotein-releasing ABC transporter permease subunit [Porticoccaceae bacterium]|nr:lipoprotein-releasing ABC transporter permease subunit [Porticoccaceae bacterium]
MLKNLPFFIGYRYTRSKRREGFVSFISGFSLCAMALGVAALIIVLSIMNGFDKEIKDRLLKVVPHVTVSETQGVTAEQLQNIKTMLADDEAISHVIPMVQSFVMLSYKQEQVGVALQGIDPIWPTAELLADNMISGYVQQLEPGDFSIILGSQIARKMNLFVGDKVQITLPQVSVTPVGVFPRSKRATVSGIFKVGAQVDSSVAFVHQSDARKLLRLGENFQGFQVQFNDAYAVDGWIAERGTNLFPNVKWRPWTGVMGALFQAMRMEKVVVGLLLSVIIAVAAFNIIASLVLMVADKRKDIAVIRTMGANSSLVTKIFIVQGMSVGAIGTAIGCLFGCLAAFYIGDIVAVIEKVSGVYMFDPSVYLISALPSEVIFSDVALVVCSALLISFLATLYPAWRAGQILPAEALRYDQ